MPITRKQKEDILSSLKEKFGNAKSVAFGQYAGMSVEQLSNMRREMRASNVEFKIAKKTLLKLAAKEQGLELPDEIMEGTVGAVFSYDDAISGPKIIKTTSKKIDVLKLLGGIMDGAVLSVDEMTELASLPSREQLLAKFMMMMRAPLQSFHGSVSSPLSSFARGLSAYAEQMPSDGADAPEVTSEPEKADVAEVTADAPLEDAEAPAEEAETSEENSEDQS